MKTSKKIYRRINTSYIGGFTLIEMMVSLAIFAVVAVVAAAALLKIMNANKQAQSIQAAMTNINFALDSMTRDLRVGSKYYCDSTLNSGVYDGATLANKACSVSGNTVIAFRSSQPIPSCSVVSNYAIAYRFIPVDPATVPATYRFQKAIQPSCRTAISDSDFNDIIPASNVTITDYSIIVQATTAGTQDYPLATMRISGYAGSSEINKEYFSVQTAASARLP